MEQPILKGLKEARQGAKMSLQDAASQLGIHRNTLTRWESGERTPSVVDLLKIIHLYRMTVTDFYFLSVWCWTKEKARANDAGG